MTDARSNREKLEYYCLPQVTADALNETLKKDNKIDKSRIDKANKGLLYNSFFSAWTGCKNESADSVFKKVDDVQRLASLYQLLGLEGSCGDKRELEKTTTEHINMITALGGQFKVFNTKGPFVSGTGNPHPTETGFTWHYTLGTPYLPGQGVKGLIKAWIKSEICFIQEELYRTQTYEEIVKLLDEKKDLEGSLRKWFGTAANNDVADSEGEGVSGKAGDYCFLAALPIEPPTLGIGVINPHQKGYYERGDRIEESFEDFKAIPAEIHAPEPHHYLITQKARLLFSIYPRGSVTVTEQSKQDINELFDYLEQALKWMGAGARTSNAFGRMGFDKKWTNERLQKVEAEAEKRAEEYEKSQMTPGQVKLAELEDQLSRDIEVGEANAGGICKQKLKAAVDEAIDWPLEEREALKAIAVRIFEHHDGPKWKKKEKSKALYKIVQSL
jgi:CRISPR-associated protein Cmr6